MVSAPEDDEDSWYTRYRRSRNIAGDAPGGDDHEADTRGQAPPDSAPAGAAGSAHSLRAPHALL